MQTCAMKKTIGHSGNSTAKPSGHQKRTMSPQKYMLNAYRVLLTRARQGMVICVPKGNERTTHEGFPEDPTRQPSFYDSTYEYFKRLGLAEI